VTGRTISGSPPSPAPLSSDLPENRITGIAQSADGYLWLGTGSGLVRFDGVRFARQSRSDSIGAPLLQPLLADHHGRLWVTTGSGGLAVYVNGHICPAGWATPSIEGSIKHLSEAGSGKLWAVSGGGSAWSWRDDRLAPAPCPATIFRLGPGRIAATVLPEDEEGAIWVGTSGDGLYRIAGTLWVAPVTGGLFRTAASAEGLGAVAAEPPTWVIRSLSDDRLNERG
jgi:ligand-binding sensor domain-containing protein